MSNHQRRIVVLIAALLGCLGCASTGSVSSARISPAAREECDIELTGSRIPRCVRRSGMITDGQDHVIVIDRAAIEHSGAADLSRLLNHYGLNR